MELQLQLAEQQLLGYCHAIEGYSLKSLLDSMGLTKSEWKSLKSKMIVDHIPKKVFDEINEHFGL